LIVNW